MSFRLDYRCKIYIGRISTNNNELEIKNEIQRLFGKVGTIISFDFRQHYAYIEYAESSQAKKAIRYDTKTIQL